MAGQWKEVVRVRFKGDRFRDHALDLGALSELSQFQRLVAETAKETWRAANPDRERLPRHFEERTRLCLRRIEEGSATAPLEVYIEEEPQPELWETEPAEVRQAIDLAYEVFAAIESDSRLPERFPKGLLPEYGNWGQSLADDEEVEIQPPGKLPARVTRKYRERLAAYSEGPHEDCVEVSGEVLEADVRQRHFQLWTDDKTNLSVTFTEAQEDEVTTALKQHRALRMKVKGCGDVSPQGKLLRIKQVEELTIHPVGEVPYDRTARPIEDVIAELTAQVPQAEWDRLPNDLTDHLDHYLYGTPKR
jgi:hypothetical protein